MSQTMSTPNEVWGKWEGKLVDGKFPLQKWLGGSDHSAVFLTERGGGSPQRAAIKLIRADDLDSDDQLSRWAESAKFPHRNLIRLFGDGRFQFNGVPFLYVVMEYAEENLAEVLPLRALSAAEVSEMLPPAAAALAPLHQAGLVHSRVKPSNVMAVDNQLKLSADGLYKTGESGNRRIISAYDAPEVGTVGWSPAADVWSLGITLLAVLTQNEPKGNAKGVGEVSVPAAIPQPLRGTLQSCLQIDPGRRCTVNDILNQLSPQPSRRGASTDSKIVEPHSSKGKPNRWIALPVAAVLLFAVAWIGGKWIGGKMLHRQPAASVSAPLNSNSSEISGAQSPAQTPALFSEKQHPVAEPGGRGSVLQQVLPEVSRGSQNTISGHVRVSVQIAVDPAGNVSQAKFLSAGPSKYFAARAMAAARKWKFNPPQMGGKAVASDWILRFQFGRTSTQVFPTEINP